MRRLFLSFSVTDDAGGRDFVRRLFARLDEQSIEPWVYESPAGRIRPGASITETCRSKIDESDLFAVYLTEQALRSDYVAMEVNHALEMCQRRALPIVPLIATQRSRSEWPPSLAKAAEFRGQALPDPPTDAIEDVVVELCQRLQVEYSAPRPRTPRLPLAHRLTQEMQHRKSSSSYDMNDFHRLLKKCDLVADAIGAQNHGRARQLLDSVLVDLELEYGLADPYYPRIVYASVLMAEANAGRRPFTEVERYFADLIAEKGQYLDANAYAGRANALMSLGRYEAALEDYREAERHLEGPDAALVYNMVRARVLGHLPMDRQELERRRASLGEGIVTRVPGDLARLASALSLAYAYMGDTRAALDLWQEIRDKSEVFAEVVLDICHHLHRRACEVVTRSAFAAALTVLSQYLAVRRDLPDEALCPLRHLEARILFDSGQQRLARATIDALVEQYPTSPVLGVDAAIFAVADADLGRARRLCQRVTALHDPSQCSPALSFREFNFALGQAFWLLGRSTEARESFRRSGYADTLWYEQTLRDEFGRLRQ